MCLRIYKIFEKVKTFIKSKNYIKTETIYISHCGGYSSKSTSWTMKFNKKLKSSWLLYFLTITFFEEILYDFEPIVYFYQQQNLKKIQFYEALVVYILKSCLPNKKLLK